MVAAHGHRMFTRGNYAGPMILPTIDPGPSPTEDELAPYREVLRGDVDALRMIAELAWQRDRRERDADAFLIGDAVAAFPALGFHDYDEYRASTLWRRIKRQELRKAGGRCAACGEGTRTIHHRDYRPRVLRGDDRAPLIALCGQCHDRVHYAEGGRKRSWGEGESILCAMVTDRKT
jgi:hypothetical protein